MTTQSMRKQSLAAMTPFMLRHAAEKRRNLARIMREYPPSADEQAIADDLALARKYEAEAEELERLANEKEAA